MKKYLFGRRQSARRSRRSALDWIFNLDLNENSVGIADSSDHKIDDENILNDKEARMISVAKDISSPIFKSKDVPLDFYNIVSSSNMELSKFSKHHSGTPASDPQPTQVNRKADRNYKRRKSLFKQQSSASKYSKSSQKCPVFLYSDSHGLTCMCKA